MVGLLDLRARGQLDVTSAERRKVFDDLRLSRLLQSGEEERQCGWCMVFDASLSLSLSLSHTQNWSSSLRVSFSFCWSGSAVKKFVFYEVHTIIFQTFFVRAFKIVVGSWKFSMLLLYIAWDDCQIFMISASNEQLQQELEYTLLSQPDCHSWWISKMQSGRDDTLEERYAIKFCFKLGKKCHRNV